MIRIFLSKRDFRHIAPANGNVDHVARYTMRVNKTPLEVLLKILIISSVANLSGCIYAMDAFKPPRETWKAEAKLVAQAKAKASKPVDNSLPEIIIDSPTVSRSVKIVEKKSKVRVAGRAIATSGVSSISINGQEASLDEQGSFWADVLLKVGDNRITVTALSMNHRKKTESFHVVREAGTPASTSEMAAVDNDDTGTLPQINSGKYHCLIIGINSYMYIDKLKTAVNDAETLSGILKENYNFETTVILEQQATRESIMNQLNVLRSKLTEDDHLLIYYAGHGVHDKETDASYWLPIDAKVDNDTNWIDTKSITDQLKRITARHVLVVADSCYSGTISRSVDPSLSGNQTRDRFLKKLRSKSARVLISSGGNEPVSDSGGKGGHSIFSQVLIDSLKSSEKDIFTAEELFVGQLKESVAGRAEQTPEYKVIRNSGHDGGDFVFVKRNQSAPLGKAVPGYK